MSWSLFKALEDSLMLPLLWKATFFFYAIIPKVSGMRGTFCKQEGIAFDAKSRLCQTHNSLSKFPP
jgi:hypothetical protein